MDIYTYGYGYGSTTTLHTKRYALDSVIQFLARLKANPHQTLTLLYSNYNSNTNSISNSNLTLTSTLSEFEADYCIKAC